VWQTKLFTVFMAKNVEIAVLLLAIAGAVPAGAYNTVAGLWTQFHACSGFAEAERGRACARVL